MKGYYEKKSTNKEPESESWSARSRNKTPEIGKKKSISFKYIYKI